MSQSKEQTGAATRPVRRRSGPVVSGNGSAGEEMDGPARSRRDYRRPLPLTHSGRLPAWKRAMDIGGACLGLAGLAPLFLAVALWIKLVSRGPVFYVQERFGLRGKPFRIWKFRTMRVGANPGEHREYVRRLLHSNATARKIDDRYRLIPLGKWLRAVAIDELPQLVNVLAGDMSLVGPRPDVIPPDDYKDWQRERFDAVPGMTGLWQVNGKNKTTFEEMVRYDISYIHRRSLWLDLRILALTGPAVVQQVFQG